jgi:predicted nucleic acid-binding Zn ribbon protein
VTPPDPPRRSDRDPAVYARLRARQARARQRLERERFDPAPPTDDDWTIEDRDGLRRLPSAPSSVGDVLDEVLRQRRWGERLRGVALMDHWDDVVGAELAQHCHPVRLAGGILTVAAATPTWATQLRYLSGRIRLQANRALGEPLVDEVVVVVGRRRD